MVEPQVPIYPRNQTHIPIRLLADIAILLEKATAVKAFFIRSINGASATIMGRDSVSPKPFSVKEKTDSRRNSITRGYVPAPKNFNPDDYDKGIAVVKIVRKEKRKGCLLPRFYPFIKKHVRVLGKDGLAFSSDADLLAFAIEKKNNSDRYNNPIDLLPSAKRIKNKRVSPYVVKAESLKPSVLSQEDPQYGNVCSLMRTILLTQDMLVEMSLMRRLIMHNVESDNPFAKKEIDFPVTLITSREDVGKLLGLCHLAYCQKREGGF